MKSRRQKTHLPFSCWGLSGASGWKQACTGQSRAFTCMSLRRTAWTCLVTRARKSSNLIVTFACCSCPAGVNLLCVVGTTLSCSAVLAARGIHTSVSVDYFLYSGRSEQRDGHSPDTVVSDTSLGRGSCCPKKTILLPSPFLVLLLGFPASSFFFLWGSP
jgi:hypothetical protein